MHMTFAAGYLPALFLEGNIWRKMAGFLRAERASRYPTNSVKGLKETRSTDPYVWSGLVLSSSATSLPREGRCSFYAMPLENCTETNI